MPHLASRSLLRAGLAVAAGALLIPSAASADALVSAGPVKVRDYQMTVMASDGKSDSLIVMFRRPDGKASQTHMYSFAKGVAVKVSGNLGSATVKGNLGRFGAVNLKLRGAGPVKSYGVPKGCSGKGSKGRAGTLAGSLQLVADSTYFKTVSKKQLKAQAFKTGAFTCGGDTGGTGGGGTGGSGDTMLSAFPEAGADTLTVSATKAADGSVTQQVMRMDDSAATAPASIMHHITVPAAASAFTVADGLASATLTGASRFLTGAATFTSEGDAGTVASGTLAGNLVAKFDSIGDVALTAGGPSATLMRR